MIECHDLSVTLDQTTCLESINLSMSSTGITTIVGPNGAGKSVLLKTLAGLQAPSSGSITLSVKEVGWVPQSPVLLDRSVYDNLVLPLNLNGITDAQNLAQAALDWANIHTLGHSYALRLSLGQQQLVALARAWALKPKLLLLDEPCASLDPQRQQHVENLLRELSQQGCKIVMSSHLLSQAERLADDVVFLDDGRLVIHTSQAAFFDAQSLQVQPTIRERIEAFIRYA